MKKIIALSFTFSLFLILGITIFTNHSSSVVNASSQNLKLKIEDDEYDLPVFIYRCEYDYQDGTSKVGSAGWIYPEGISKPENKYWKETIFQIDDYESFEEFSNSRYKFTYSIDQDDYFSYYDDALSNNFIVVTLDSSFEYGHLLNGRTKSEIFANNSDIVGIYTANDEEIKIELIDYGTPVIDGYEGIYVSNVDHPVTVEEIKNCLKAFDNIDGDITNKINVKEDNYTTNNNIVGEYSVIFEVIDNAGNIATLTIIVHVLDLTNPIIHAPDVLFSKLSDPLDLESAIETHFEITDNYDDEIWASLEKIEDTYSENMNAPGSYKVTYKVTDQSGNYAIKSIGIVCTDDIKPTLSGNATYTKSTEIPLEISDIMNDLHAEDNYDGDISNRIVVKEDLFTGNGRKVGNYNVKFSVTDYSGNESDEFIVTIEVKDITLPYFTISDTIINVSEYSQMNKDQIILFMQKCGQIDATQEPNVTFLIDEYSDNKQTPGHYKISAKVKYKNGEEKIVDLTINVKEHTQENKEIEEQKTSFFERIFNWFGNLFSSLIAFLSNLWKKLLLILK